MLLSFFLSMAFALEARALALVPELTGPHKVGTTVLELVDSSRLDPFAPTPQPRDLVVSLFYPTKSHPKHTRNCTLAPQFPKVTAARIDAMFNATSSLAESIITRSCTDSPLSWPDLPLILLGPGLGTSRLFYSDMAEDLASHGWNVVTVDHTYDSCIVEFPDGRVVYPSDSPVAANATLEQYLDIRVKDLKFVLDSLANSSVTSRIPGLGRASSGLKTKKVGCFGHSFGGASSLQLIHDDKRCVVGANLDGGLFGSVIQEGTDVPFLFFGRPDHNRHTDDTWAAAWTNLRGFKREYIVNGTTHGDFSDLPIYRDLLGDQFPEALAQSLGNITGARILDIETTFVGALFDRFLKGHGGELLDGKGMKNWPEVTLVK
ncbi:Alpha/Beta hydrolase protein [Xylariaceae sp. AK1471]|nr:Alpha/Beta hydrolase protein [Xylariaceae sp. AK1471]